MTVIVMEGGVVVCEYELRVVVVDTCEVKVSVGEGMEWNGMKERDESSRG